MKKAFVLVAGLGLSLNVLAVDAGSAAAVAGDYIEADATGCSLLAERVKMNLSSNVLFAYGCNITDSVIGVASCHKSGKKGTWEEPVMIPDPAAPGSMIADPTGATTTVFGGKAYLGATSGGTIFPKNTTTCIEGGAVTAEATTAAGL